MSAAYNDGTVQYGSRALVVLQNDGATQRGSGAYVFDNLTINRPTKAIDRTNEIGEPSGSVGINDFVTGSGQVQLAADATPEIVNGDRIFFDGEVGSNEQLNGTVEKFFITSVIRAMTKDGEVKLTVNLRKQYGA